VQSITVIKLKAEPPRQVTGIPHLVKNREWGSLSLF